MSSARQLLKKLSRKTSKVKEVSINTNQFKQHLEAFLHASSILNDNENVIDIEFTGSEGKTLPLKIYLKDNKSGGT